MELNKLAAIFPGGRGNFDWLIRHFFSSITEEQVGSSANLILDWILLNVRSWDVGEVAEYAYIFECDIERKCPGLSERIKPVLQEM